MATAQLLIDSKSAEIRHRTGISAPDTFVFLAKSGEKGTVFFDAREYAIQEIRLKKAGTGVAIERLEPYLEKADAMKKDLPRQKKALLAILEAKGVEAVEVSESLPYGWATVLIDAGIAVSVRDFSRDRRNKSEREIALMIEAQRVTEGAYDIVRDMLRRSAIDGDRIVLDEETLTSEWVKAELKTYFLKKGYSNPAGMVISSGEQSARPHDDGSGPLLPNQFIIADIFPQNDETGYFADMTRTYVKGEPTARMREIYDAVREVQQAVLDYVAVGVRCEDVYKKTVEEFTKRGFETSPEKGFMHRTGHGLGLDIHEGSSFATGDPDVLEPGVAMSVEPGLYYPGIGGVRLEDIVVFHQDGTKQDITDYEKADYIIP